MAQPLPVKLASVILPFYFLPPYSLIINKLTHFGGDFDFKTAVISA